MQSKSLFANTAYLTVASIAQKAIAFVYFAIIARFVGPEDTGIYFLALGLSTTIAVFADLGVTSVLVREIAKNPTAPEKWLGPVMGIKAFAIPFTVALLFVALPVANGVSALFDTVLFSKEIVVLVRVSALIVVADALSLTFFGVLRGARNLSYESFGIFIGQAITTLVGGILLATGEATLTYLMVALMAGSLWNMGFAGFLVYRRYSFSVFKPNFKAVPRTLRIASAFFIGAIFVKIVSYTDSVVINAYHGDAVVGYYAVAYKLAYAFQFIPLVFVAALYPEMSAQIEDKKRLVKTTEKAFWYMGFVSFPLVFGIWSIADQIIPLFYSASFGASILPLQVLIFVLIFIFFDFPLGSLLNAGHRQRAKTIITGCAVVVNVILNLILVPRIGAVGASISGVISFAFMFVVDYLVAQRIAPLSHSLLLELVLRIGLPSVVMAGAVVTVKEFIPIYLSIALGAGVFLVGVTLTGAIKRFHALRYGA